MPATEPAARTVYADHAATCACMPEVLEAMLPYLAGPAGNAASPHALGRRAANAVEEARELVAETLGCPEGAVVFCSGGTEADNQALITAVHWGATRGRTRVVVSAVEHHAVLETAESLRKACGAQVDLVPVDELGRVRLDELERVLGAGDACLVSVMTANNETGVLQPCTEAAAIAHRAGALFHTDAVAAAGHVPLSWEETGCDLMSLAAHKFGGPQGAGALLCAPRALGGPLAAVPLLHGGSQELGRRAGTVNVAGAVGLARALELSVAALAQSMPYVAGLRDTLEERLAALEGARVMGAGAPRLPGTSCLCLEGVERQVLVAALDCAGVCAGSGSACASGASRPSHVLAAMGVPEELARGQLRLSLGTDNTEGDVDALVKAVVACTARIRELEREC